MDAPKTIRIQAAHMRRANVEEPIMKNDSIAVELRRKGSRIWVCKPSATKCPGIGGKPENDPMSNIDRKADRRSSQTSLGDPIQNCVFPAPNAPQIANGIARSSFAILSGCSFQDIFVVCPAIPDRSFTEAVHELDIPVHV